VIDTDLLYLLENTFDRNPNPKGSFTLLRSRAERSKDRNKATAVTIKLQRSNALICFTEHTLKRIKNEALPRYATQKCEQALTLTLALKLNNVFGLTK